MDTIQIMAMRDFSTPSKDDDQSSGTGSGNNSNITASNTALAGLMGQPPIAKDVDATDTLINYNTRFKKSDPIAFRDEIVNQTMGVLLSMNKPNTLLVGPAGCGKTAIVEDIARRIANSDSTVPDALLGSTVYELPLSAIVSGSGVVGELEQKVETILDFACDAKNKAILFIDEAHMLVSNDQHLYGRIAQLLKPSLSRGDLHVIAATTIQEAGDFASDPAFSRRFSRVIVDELNQAQTLEILKLRRPALVMHYGTNVTISDDVLAECVSIADRWSAAGSHRPDNAITLLDRACGDAVVGRKVKEAAVADDPTLLQAIQAIKNIPVTPTVLRKCAMKLMTGQAKQDKIDFDAFAEAAGHIKGQDAAVRAITDALKRRDLALFPNKRPCTFLLAGPSGCGKTELAKIVAEQVCGSAPIILNMTEYADAATINRIIGSPAGYVGSDSHAELPFDILESNPYQVILLDEIEKGHRSVQRLFMSVFDEGTLKAASGKTYDFSKCIIFATTNAGHSTGSHAPIGFSTMTKTVADTASTLSNWFDLEFLNRFQAILDFEPIPREVYRDILADKYAITRERLIEAADRRVKKLPDSLSDDVLDDMVEKTYVRDFGARPAERTIHTYIEDTLLAPKPSACSSSGQGQPAATLILHEEDGMLTTEIKH